MLLNPISLNYRHEIILRKYLDNVLTYIKEVTPEEDRYEEFIDIANIIIEHHNNYRSDVLVTANYQDFMSLIPTHFTAMINGYLTGIENENNRNSVRVYKHILSEEAYNYIDKIQDIKIERDI
jgi:hypothetical protein